VAVTYFNILEPKKTRVFFSMLAISGGALIYFKLPRLPLLLLLIREISRLREAWSNGGMIMTEENQITGYGNTLRLYYK
jgi:hypothetical protein